MDKTVLIVDDCVNVHEKLKNIFETIGFKKIIFAQNGLEALELADEADIISLDIIMPHMDGIECYTELKKKYGDNKKICIITFLNKDDAFKQRYCETIAPNAIFAKYPDPERLRAFLCNDSDDSSSNVDSPISDQQASVEAI